MISVILLILTLLLIVVGGICGFRRGILKEGVRAVLWIVLFGCSLFFIPQFTDKVPLLVAERFGIVAVDVEQLVAELLKKVQFISEDTFLFAPLSGFIRTLIVPFIVIVFFWATGLLSWIIYLIISVILRKKLEQPQRIGQIAGLVVGIVFALFSGALTIFPVAQISTSLYQGKISESLMEKYPVIETVEDTYAGTLVQKIYKLSAMETAGAFVHNSINNQMIIKNSHNIWTEFPKLINFGSAAYNAYEAFESFGDGTVSMENELKQLTKSLFELDFISDEEKIGLIKRLRSTAESSFDNEIFNILFSRFPFESKDQIISDVTVVGSLFDILVQEGMLDSLQNGTAVGSFTEAKVLKVLDKCYEFSAAEELVPQFINMFSYAILGDGNQIVQTENITWYSQTKDDIAEVVSFTFWVSEELKKRDTMSSEDKLAVIDKIKALEDNSVVNKEILKEYVDCFVEIKEIP